MINSISETGKTVLNKLHKECWKILDIEKSGRSTKLNSFNMVMKLEKIN